MSETVCPGDFWPITLYLLDEFARNKMMIEVSETDLDARSEERSVKSALWNGLRGKCPNCQEGAMFQGYLKVCDSCAACGEELHHQRADDGPAWATIVLVGHLMVPVLLYVFNNWRPEPWVMAIGLSAVFSMLCLVLLPRIKGMFVGLQWAKRLHGFGGEAD